MRKLLRGLGVAILIVARLTYAQSPGQVTAQPGNLAGLLFASSFGQWQVPQGNQGQFSWSSATFCQRDADGFYLNPVFQVGTPVTIVDQNPANTETVIPTAVSITGSGCSITVAPVHPHNSFYLKSGTAGLQEAINYAKNLPYQVVTTPDWTRLGGVDGTLTGAVSGNANVGIVDWRTNCPVPYSWSGSAYVAGPSWCSGGGGSGTVTTVSCDPLSPIFTCNVLNPTTAPEIQFTLDTAQNLGFFGNVAGSTGPPSFVTLVAGANITLTPATGPTPNTLTISAAGGGSGGCSSGGIPTTGGIVDGDTTSTNCGTNNRVGDTATPPAFGTTFGYTLAANNAATHVLAVGNNDLANAATVTGDNFVALGNTNLAGLVDNSPSPTDLIGIGEHNIAFTSPCSGVFCQPAEVVAIGDSNLNDFSGNDMVAIGLAVGGHLVRVNDFVILGDGAGSNFTGASDVIAIGDGAGSNLNLSNAINDLVAIGDGAASELSGTLNDVVGIGDASGSGFGDGSHDIVSIGDGAGFLPVPFEGAVAHDLVALGDAAGKGVTGNDVISIGDSVNGSGSTLGSPAHETGDDDIGIGDLADTALRTGAGNVAIGNHAGSVGWVNSGSIGNSNTDGSHNVWLGDHAGPGTTTQLSNTIAIGFQAFNSASNQTVIGNASTTSLIIFGSGDGCLSSSSGVVTGSGVACGSGGGGSAFSAITGSTNTTATMLVGTGASLSFTGSGVLNANQLGGIAISGTPATGSILTATSSSAASWASPPAGTVTSIATGSGLTGGPITNSGTISCVNGSSSVFGCVKVDGTTITASGGVISAVGGAGTVTSSGSPAAGSLAAFTSATNITTATATEVNTLIKTLTGCNIVGNVYTPQSADCVAPGGSSGFPFTLGSTSIAASSTTTAVTGLSVNGVTLNAAGSSSLFLNQAGGYTTPAGSISGGTSGEVAIFGSASSITSAIALGNTGSDIPQLSSGLLAASILPKATTAAFGAVKCDGTTILCSSGVISATGSSGLSGMTGGQVPIAATASTVTSSKALAGSGAGITTGPTTSTNLDCAQFTGTAGQITDSGLPCGLGNLPGGALGSAPYQSAPNTTALLASPTTTGNTFVYAWQPAGSAIAPFALNLTTWPAVFASLATGSGSTSCGSATGCISMNEAATAGTPTSGADYIRADSTTHSLLASLNGSAEAPIAIRLPVGNVTFTPGTGVTSATCATSYTCTNARGEFTLVGGTATTGTIATVNFSTTLGAAPFCIVNANGNGGSSTTFFDLGHGLPSTSSFTVTSGITVIGATINIDYQCAQ